MRRIFKWKKEDLAKRYMEILNEENDRLVKPEKGIENVSIDIIKELFTEVFKVEEETIRKIVSSCNTDIIARLD